MYEIKLFTAEDFDLSGGLFHPRERAAQIANAKVSRLIGSRVFRYHKNDAWCSEPVRDAKLDLQAYLFQVEEIPKKVDNCQHEAVFENVRSDTATSLCEKCGAKLRVRIKWESVE